MKRILNMTTLQTLQKLTNDNIEFRLGLHTVYMDIDKAVELIESHSSVDYHEKPLPPNTNAMLWTLRAGTAGTLLLGQTLAKRYITGVIGLVVD
jgi:DNA-binding NtrC family response regulator